MHQLASQLSRFEHISDAFRSLSIFLIAGDEKEKEEKGGKQQHEEGG